MAILSSKYPMYIEQANYPYTDAMLTMASVVAQLLLTRKKLDNWMIWMVVNTISIVLYVMMGMYFTVLLYGIYLIIAFTAYRNWYKELQAEKLRASVFEEENRIE